MGFLGIGGWSKEQIRRRRYRERMRRRRQAAHLDRRGERTSARLHRRAARLTHRQRRRDIRTERGVDLASQINPAAVDLGQDVIEAGLQGAAAYATGGASTLGGGIMSALGDMGRTADSGGEVTPAYDGTVDFEPEVVTASPEEDGGGLGELGEWWEDASTGTKVAVVGGTLGVVGLVIYAATR